MSSKFWAYALAALAGAVLIAVSICDCKRHRKLARYGKKVVDILPRLRRAGF